MPLTKSWAVKINFSGVFQHILSLASESLHRVPASEGPADG